MKKLLQKYKPHIAAFGISAGLLLLITGAFYGWVFNTENYSTRDAKRRIVPDISLPKIDGKMYNLRDTKQPGIFVIWTSWCGPCVTELKKLETYDLGEWSYIAVNADTNRADADEFIAKNKIKKPLMLFDTDSKTLGTRSYPTMYVAFGDGYWGGPVNSIDFNDTMAEVKNTMTQSQYQPYKASKKSNEFFWNHYNWIYYESITTIAFPLFFGVFFIVIWRRFKTSKLLIFSLFLFCAWHLVINMRIIDFWSLVNFRANLSARVIAQILYSPLFWGGMIGIGILKTVNDRLRADNGS